jgi:predicted transcriptional regulator
MNAPKHHKNVTPTGGKLFTAFRCPQDVRTALETLAKADRRSVSNLIVHLLSDAITRAQNPA